MAASTLTLAAILKQDYTINFITEELNQNVAAAEYFDSQDLDVVGDVAVMPLHTGRNNSVNNAAEGEPLATPGNQKYERLLVRPKYLYGTAQITGPVLEKAKTNRGAFEVQFKGEMDRLVTDMKKRKSQLVFNGGQYIGFVWQKQNSNAFQYSGRVDETEDPFYGVKTGVYNGVSQQVQFYRLDTYATVGAPTQVTSITSDTLTLAANVNTSSVPTGVAIAVRHLGVNAGGKSLALEQTGFVGNMAQVDHFGIDRSDPANAIMRGVVKLQDPAVPSATALTFDPIVGLQARIMQNGGGKLDAMWISPLQLASFQLLLSNVQSGTTTIRRDLSKAPGKVDPGDTAFAYANVVFKESDVAPQGTIFGFGKDTWTRAKLGTPHWVDQSGSPMIKVAGADAYTATWADYFETVCRAPRMSGCITAIEQVAF